MQLDRLADDPVHDLARIRYPLLRGVANGVFLGEDLVDADIDVLVDRGGDEKSAVALVVGRKVGSSATDRDAQGRTHKDHIGSGQARLGCSLATRCRLVNEILHPCLQGRRTPQTGIVKASFPVRAPPALCTWGVARMPRKGSDESPVLMPFQVHRRRLGGIFRAVVSVVLVCVLVYVAGT